MCQPVCGYNLQKRHRKAFDFLTFTDIIENVRSEELLIKL